HTTPWCQNRAGGWRRCASENSRARSPGSDSTPHPGRRWTAPPGSHRTGRQFFACLGGLYREGEARGTLLRLLGGGIAVTGSATLGNFQKAVDDQAHPEVHHQAPVKALNVVLG